MTAVQPPERGELSELSAECCGHPVVDHFGGCDFCSCSATHDAALRSLLARREREAAEKAWDEGYGDDLTCNEPRTNPYRAITEGAG